MDAVKALLGRFGISEASLPANEQVVDMMTSLARMAAEGSILCDVPALVRALSSLVRRLLFIDYPAWLMVHSGRTSTGRA
jgi:hypothetical protein